MKKTATDYARWGGRLLFGIYIACLIYFMFFSESYGRTISDRDYRYNLILFKEIRRFLTNWETLGATAVLINVAGNIASFVPLGFMVPILFNKFESFIQVALLSFEMSLLVEILQLVLKVGCFDVDDLLLNTMGGCIGFTIYALCRHSWRQKYAKKKII